MMKIDKSVFTADELAQYESLIAKAKVDPEAGEEEMEDQMPPVSRRRRKPGFFQKEEEMDNGYEDYEDPENPEEEEDMDKSRCKKSADPALTAALRRLDTLEKSLAMEKFREIAKKYTPLGENEVELAKTLYEMSQTNQANYDAYIGILEKSLGLVNKSGLFQEIGKSASGGSGSVIGRIEAEADSIMKSNAGMTKEQAIAKAWENNPQLIAEYDAEYRKA